SGTRIDIPAEQFVQPKVCGFNRLKGPSFCFLISHASGQKVVFDLSVRQGFEKLAPTVVDAIHKLVHDWHLSTSRDVSEVLFENNIRLPDVQAITWSHFHFDHVGNPALFPASTELIVGPGSTAAVGNGYPNEPDAPVLASDWEGRELVELDFGETNDTLQIGQFKALDWFGDGSIFVLHTPGHAVGHLCGLARVLGDSYVLMAGVACDGHTAPFFQPAKDYTHDYKQCLSTLEGIAELDAKDNVFVVLAHDNHALSIFEEKDDLGMRWLFPEKSIDSWKSNGLKQAIRWKFLADFGHSVD
ncbi:metallo-beta-lactamase superfamily protein, partial [Penicillium cinerascens]